MFLVHLGYDLTNSWGLALVQAKRLHDALVQKFGLQLNIPISTFRYSGGPVAISLPYFKPVDTLRVILAEHDWLLLGGRLADSETPRLLLSFWEKYRLQHPSHEVFKFDRDKLSRTIPVTIHGDGGRTQKKQPLEIVSLQAVIGLNTRASTEPLRCQCQTSLESGGGDFRSPSLNVKYNTLLTHFLGFAFPSKKYKDWPKLLQAILGEFCSNLALACREGVPHKNGQRFFVGVLGFKLDMEWGAKAGMLTRSYQNVGHVNERACCHECEAGLPGIPFEDASSSAEWTKTRFVSVPWRGIPAWKDVPFDKSKEAMFLRRDSFHVFRLGIARNFVASCVFLLCYLRCCSASFNAFLLM